MSSSQRSGSEDEVSPISVTVSYAPVADEPLIKKMMPAYLRELGVGEDYPYLSLYWTEDSRIPYLFFIERNPCGFALVRSVGDDTHSLAEFYVVPEVRRRSIGLSAARQLFSFHPGRWQLSVLESNLSGKAFWKRTLAMLGKDVHQQHDGAVKIYQYSFFYSEE